MKSASLLYLLFTGLPLAGAAQPHRAANGTPRRGELVGARPSGELLARPRAEAPARRAASADLVQQHLLGTDVNLARTEAAQLPELYEQFIATTREERRHWSFADWDAAGEVLALLNQRYEQVRTDLPLEERLRVRTFQGEFHTLRGAREAKARLD